MAAWAKRLAENVPGDFFVDSTCIDCGTCRQVAPATFADGRDASYVHSQPGGADEAHRARMALVACPVAAIGTRARHPVGAARAAFPEPIEDGVHYCGWAADASFGARSYLVVRERGNILVDSPRYAAPLVERIAELGGVRWMFLTHRDDVADHAKFRKRFGCERILHGADVTPATRNVEMQLTGTEPIALDDEVRLIPVPGHTRGSVCMHYRERFLFAGDHVWWDPDGRRVHASRNVCWYDWRRQIESMARLAGYPFEWLLPGHGTRVHLPADAMAAELARCIALMKRI